jgi:hypothetical protein
MTLPVQRFVHITTAIQYDGTNSAEIIAMIGGTDPTVSEVDGVWETDDGVHSPLTVHAGDWYLPGMWFTSAAEFEACYLPAPEA